VGHLMTPDTLRAMADGLGEGSSGGSDNGSDNRSHDGSSLDRWLSDLRSDDARIARQRERWLDRQNTESATMLGVLVDLVESHATVVLETAGGRRLSGNLRAVGLDFCALVEHGRWNLVPLAAVTLAKATSARRSAAGDRSAPLDSSLAEALLEVLEDRARLGVNVASGTHLGGTIVSVGQDLITLRLDGDQGHAHIPLASIDAITLG
jgi:hypothetical protein